MKKRRFALLALSLSLLSAMLFLLSGCGGTVASNAAPPPTPPPPTTTTPQGSIESINHIVLMYQENRSFDHYFSDLNNYRVAHGLPADADVAPPGVTNPGHGGTGPIARFHLHDKCMENLSPFWNESHVAFNLHNPSSSTPTMDGFAVAAGGFAANTGESDVAGKRAMGYYTAADLPYYYFMATQFATSDRWFSPVMSRTQLNRIFGLGGTDAGFIYPPGSAEDPRGLPPIKNIFELLEDAKITWKIYVKAGAKDLVGIPQNTYMSYFQPFASKHKDRIVPRAQYLTDLQNGTLPQVTMIEPDGQNEHPNTELEVGAVSVSNLINALMASTAWKDSVFILTYDEGGGLYDHVPPQPAVLPDNIPPRLTAHDVRGTYDHTGFRVPLIVVSPFAKKGFVSHTVMDYTAILKFIETRFKLPSMTARDAAQPDMTEFFDFNNPPWMTPPTGVPTQPTVGPCNFQLP